MLWRFDLTDYEQVKANAAIIQVFITADPDSRMPPANYGPPLSAQQITTFQQWIRMATRRETFQHGSVQNDATRLKRRM